MRNVVFLLPVALLACAPEADEAGLPQSVNGYIVDGNLPAGTDLEAVIAEMSPGGFALIGDPNSTDVALVREDTEAARLAVADFTPVDGTCDNCGAVSCVAGVTSYKLDFDLLHSGGGDDESYRLLRDHTVNYNVTGESPKTFSQDEGDDVHVVTTGTVSSCTSSLKYFFDLETVSKSVFVTNGVYTGNLGGTAGADAICQAEAEAADLGLAADGYNWKAWLSTTSTSPSSTFTAANAPYRTVNGALVGFGYAAFQSRNHEAAIDTDASGNSVFGTTAVWSSTLPNGDLPAAIVRNCNDWTNDVVITPGITNDEVGRIGDATQSGMGNPMWTSVAGSRRCDQPAHLYCVEQ